MLFPSLAGSVLECKESPVDGFKGTRIWMGLANLLDQGLHLDGSDTQDLEMRDSFRECLNQCLIYSLILSHSVSHLVSDSECHLVSHLPSQSFSFSVSFSVSFYLIQCPT